MAVDFATHAGEICDAGAELARDLDAPIVLLHVLQLGGVRPEIAIRVEDRAGPVRELVEQDATRLMAPLVERVEAAGVRVELQLRDGDPIARIRAAVIENDARYLVIGSDISSGLKRLLGAGFTEQILHSTPCPVLVVRTMGTDPAPGPGAARTRVATEADG
ncbi:MAG: universal stress protein [Proteobacteria bacterium]|nr:universal stress protein [Pseudomonadota bacterium]